MACAGYIKIQFSFYAEWKYNATNYVKGSFI